VTFLISFRFWWPEGCDEHLPIIILGVLRLRARNPLLRDRSARRFAQDDGSVGEPEKKQQVHSAPPDFLSRLVALARFMRLPVREAAYVAAGGSAM
jgi:hypothetical protein